MAQPGRIGQRHRDRQKRMAGSCRERRRYHEELAPSGRTSKRKAVWAPAAARSKLASLSAAGSTHFFQPNVRGCCRGCGLGQSNSNAQAFTRVRRRKAKAVSRPENFSSEVFRPRTKKPRRGRGFWHRVFSARKVHEKFGTTRRRVFGWRSDKPRHIGRRSQNRQLDSFGGWLGCS
jgi:hypothetical protein